MISEIYEVIVYFFHLTLKTELLWIILPLAIATIVMIFYSEKYQGECPGWNSYVANSLVLLFVSVVLFKYIYSIDGLGIVNYIIYPSKFIATSLLLTFGIVLSFLNFERLLPEKISQVITFPLNINLVAYIVIIFVYIGFKNGSNLPLALENNWILFFSLILLFLILFIIFNLIRIPIRKLFLGLKKMKEKEVIDDIIAEKRKIESKKKEIKQEESKLKKSQLKKWDGEKKKAIKIKKIIKKPAKKI